tara:strand:- start:139 stop:837 length:699 start_codon:yes stop_codon:yes gene_type:complete
MPTIDTIPNTAIPRIPIIEIPVEQSLPNTPYITKTLPPTLTMPCVTLRSDGTKNSQLFVDDPNGNKLVCPLPSYVPLQYDKKKILLIEEAKPPTNVDPPETDVEQPEVPKLPPEEPPCPDPKKNNPRIGDLNAKGTEKVVGFEWVEETKECVVQYKPTTAVEKYLPSLNTVSTTFAITVVATTAATLTPILNRVLKPLFKQAIGKVKKAIGKKGTKFSGKKPMKSKINKSDK